MPLENFDVAIEEVLRNEGGYSNHPTDRGGETKYGITRRRYPDLDIASLTLEEARAIYFRDYWAPYGAGLLEAPELATKVFDLQVVMGPRQATRCLQRALRSARRPVLIDGSLGPITAAEANASSTEILLAAIRSEAAGIFRQIVISRPEQRVFLGGWENRAYK